MKLIKSKAELIQQREGLSGLYSHIELCGRTCYKSEDKITNTSAKKFFDRMYEGKHRAMLEHGTAYLEMFVDTNDDDYLSFESRYLKNPYSKVVYDGAKCYVTTNFRVITENLWFADVQYANKLSFHERRYTFKFTCSRAIANELVRHRVFSFAQESQRYCNYGRDKFGNEVTSIAPYWLPELAGKSIKTMVEDIEARDAIKDDQRTVSASWFTSALIDAERCYFEMLNGKSSPQQARDVLPNATKTELCMTGFSSDWRHLLDLRLFQRTGVVHPDMLDLMQKLQKVMQENNVWDDIMNQKSKFE
jgi:thymidylate synthase (FAD)